MMHTTWRAVRWTLGGACLVIGVLGLLMPVLPGWAFIIPGLLLLGFDFACVDRALCDAQTKYPRQKGWLGRLRGWLPACKKQHHGSAGTP